MKARIKKNDLVLVVSGKDKGKQGTVIKTLPKKNKMLIKDIGIVTRHTKPRRTGETGGIKKEESFIHSSKVMPICTACKNPTRIGSRKLESGKQVRMCVKCKEIF